MLTEVLESMSVQRLMGLLQTRYGKGFELSLMGDAAFAETDEDVPSFAGGILKIPIHHESRFLGTVNIPKAEDLSADDARSITHLVRLIMEPMLYKMFLDLQGQQEAKDRENIRDLFQDITPAFHEADENELETGVLVMHSKSPVTLHKVALEAHEISRRWAFSRFQDMASEIKNAADIKDLGRMTLFVEELSDVTYEQQIHLADFLETMNQSEHPLLLVGTSMTWEKIEESSSVEPRLKSLLKNHRLEVDRLPTQMNLLRQSLELYLEKATEV